MRFFTARPTLRSADPRYAPPAWTYNALGGLAAAVDPGLFLAGKTIAATLIDLLTQPADLAHCKAEFVERTGGGIGGDGGSAHSSRRLRRPDDLPWPEYVTTPSGEEWFLPTPIAGANRSL